MEKITQKDLDFVKRIASMVKRKHKLPIDLEDLYSAGLEGLVIAKKSFNPEMNNNFNGYAYAKIRWAMLDFARYNFRQGFVDRIENEAKQDFVPVFDNVIENINNSERLHILKRIIDSFDYRECKLSKMYFFDGKNLKEIAKIFGVNKSSTSKMHKKIMQKITSRVMVEAY